nr:MAG TPA: hypothetical protein [Bacteriophage sp.]
MLAPLNFHPRTRRPDTLYTCRVWDGMGGRDLSESSSMA